MSCESIHAYNLLFLLSGIFSSILLIVFFYYLPCNCAAKLKTRFTKTNKRIHERELQLETYIKLTIMKDKVDLSNYEVELKEINNLSNDFIPEAVFNYLFRYILQINNNVNVESKMPHAFYKGLIRTDLTEAIAYYKELEAKYGLNNQNNEGNGMNMNNLNNEGNSENPNPFRLIIEEMENVNDDNPLTKFRVVLRIVGGLRYLSFLKEIYYGIEFVMKGVEDYNRQIIVRKDDILFSLMQ